MGRYNNAAIRFRHSLRKLGRGHASFFIVVLGLLSMAALFGLLAELIEEILFDRTAGDFDLRVFQWLQSLRTPFLDSVFLTATRLGDPPALMAIAATCGAILLFARRDFEVFALVTCFFGTGITMMALKWLLLRNRPVPAVPLVTEDNPAFPSAHASLSLIVYVFAAYILAQRLSASRHRLLAFALGLGLPSLIGLSRLYLGVHWLSDVLGGYALGGIWLALLLTIAELRRHGKRPRVRSINRDRRDGD